MVWKCYLAGAKITTGLDCKIKRVAHRVIVPIISPIAILSHGTTNAAFLMFRGLSRQVEANPSEALAKSPNIVSTRLKFANSFKAKKVFKNIVLKLLNLAVPQHIGYTNHRPSLIVSGVVF